MSAAAVIAIRRKRLVRRFREAGATDLEHAVTLEALGERRSWLFNHMTRHGVFLPAQNDRFYMDEPVATEFLRRRRQRALVMTGVFLLVLLLLSAFGFLGR